jgi:DNA-binding transcriptional ArsR family regulator
VDEGVTLDHVFSALADPTRRLVVETLLDEGETSVPMLTGRLPMSRQAVAKHLAALDEAGLLTRSPGKGREVRYALKPGALDDAAAWMDRAERDWDRRLARLRRTVERG